jgi:hypothetical protein
MQTRASSKEWEEGSDPPPYLLPAYLIRCRMLSHGLGKTLLA